MPYETDVYGQALIAHVLPLLGQAVLDAGVEVAKELYEAPTIFEVENAQQWVINALADFLLLCQCDHSEDWRYPTLKPHQLINTDYAAAFFEVDEQAE